MSAWNGATPGRGSQGLKSSERVDGPGVPGDVGWDQGSLENEGGRGGPEVW